MKIACKWDRLSEKTSLSGPYLLNMYKVMEVSLSDEVIFVK